MGPLLQSIRLPILPNYKLSFENYFDNYVMVSLPFFFVSFFQSSLLDLSPIIILEKVLIVFISVFTSDVCKLLEINRCLNDLENILLLY